jgi:hypothetical protein
MRNENRKRKQKRSDKKVKSKRNDGEKLKEKDRDRRESTAPFLDHGQVQALKEVNKDKHKRDESRNCGGRSGK